MTSNFVRTLEAQDQRINETGVWNALIEQKMGYFPEWKFAEIASMLSRFFSDSFSLSTDSAGEIMYITPVLDSHGDNADRTELMRKSLALSMYSYDFPKVEESHMANVIIESKTPTVLGVKKEDGRLKAFVVYPPSRLTGNEFVLISMHVGSFGPVVNYYSSLEEISELVGLTTRNTKGDVLSLNTNDPILLAYLSFDSSKKD